MVESALDHAAHCVFQIGIVVDHDRGITAEFQRDLLLPRARLERPADLVRTGEAEQFEPFVGGEKIGTITAGGQNREGAFGQHIAFGENLADDQRAERGLARGLQHEGAADRDGWCDLVRGEIEREIEGRDEAARPHRHALPDRLIAGGSFRNVERHDLAAHADRFLGGNLEGVDQPVDLALAVADRLARLDTERISELVIAFAEAGNAMLEHVLALISRQPRHRLCGARCTRNRLVNDLGCGERGAKRHLAGKLVRHRKIGVGLLRPVVEIERVSVFELGGIGHSRETPFPLNGLSPCPVPLVPELRIEDRADRLALQIMI